MIDFKKLDGPYGIPIYFQKLPDIVQSVAMEWVIFTGSGDDSKVGTNGAHHWFEHVPFRGTKRFPGGYAAIKGPFTRYGGVLNAYTSPVNTSYWAHIQKGQWKMALDIITDLWSQPLLTDEGIDAERTIIIEEIRQRRSTAMGNAAYEQMYRIWPGHPLGHHVLGTEESLKAITPEQLRKIHKADYDRSRAAFFISGNLTEEEILSYAAENFKVTPDNGLNAKREVTSYGPLPAWSLGAETVVETQFPSSIVYTLFPFANKNSIEDLIFLDFLTSMLIEGGMDSPLYRIVREERKLAYTVRPGKYTHPDGGYIGLVVETKTENIEKAKQAFVDVFKDAELRSPERFSKVKDGIYSDEKMRSISAIGLNEVGVDRFIDYKKIITDEEYNSYVEKITLEEVVRAFDAMTPDKAHIYIYKGKS